MRRVAWFVVVMLGLVAPAAGLRAELDIAADPPKAGAFQLVVMEADGCTYCGIFRRDVLPSYEASERAKDMPVRFIDVNDVEKARLDLQAPVNIVPTFIVMKDNKEVGRIPGYLGPENFYPTIKYLMSTAP